MKLVLAFLLALPLVAQETGRYFAAIWPEGCVRVPRESCWTYAYLPDGWTVAKATSGPSWAYQLVAPPSPPGSGTGASWATDLLDCKPSVAGAVATIKGPCRVNMGGEVFSITVDATATLSGASTNGTVRWYWDADGILRADKGGSAATLTCNASCRTAAITNPGPRVGLPVAEMEYTANVFTILRDKRAVYGIKIVECGAGTTCVERQGVTTISVP
jgi:hypothetical protein